MKRNPMVYLVRKDGRQSGFITNRRDALRVQRSNPGSVVYGMNARYFRHVGGVWDAPTFALCADEVIA